MIFCPPIAPSSIPADLAFSCAWQGSWGYWIGGVYVGQTPISIVFTVVLLVGIALLVRGTHAR